MTVGTGRGGGGTVHGDKEFVKGLQRVRPPAPSTTYPYHTPPTPLPTAHHSTTHMCNTSPKLATHQSLPATHHYSKPPNHHPRLNSTTHSSSTPNRHYSLLTHTHTLTPHTIHNTAPTLHTSAIDTYQPPTNRPPITHQPPPIT